MHHRGCGFRRLAAVGSSARAARYGAALVAASLLSFLPSCGGEQRDAEIRAEEAATAADGPAAGVATESGADQAGGTPASLDRALVLALAQFLPSEGEGARPVPGAARMEFLYRQAGEWRMTAVEDPESNVFHKVMAIEAPGGGTALVSAGGMAAALKLWTPGPDGLEARTLWSKDFGGKFSRMRDVEAADLDGDGRLDLAVATHDQGVVAVVTPTADGAEVEEIDQEPDTFVHEIEIGDLDRDGVPEVYATPSEPNRLDGSVQTGVVTRYVPAKGEGRTVVADLGDRHAKEILVTDIDGDGRDELYVAVEGHVDATTRQLVHGVEVRRYTADSDPKQGVVIAEVNDRLARFLTVGDGDGDGVPEIVLATFSKGLWQLRPGEDLDGRWQQATIDTRSGGFEHASVFADLDGDGRDELYVASDNHKEVRRYTWPETSSRPVREVIYRRPDDRSVFTWNIMPVPIELVPRP